MFAGVVVSKDDIVNDHFFIFFDFLLFEDARLIYSKRFLRNMFFVMMLSYFKITNKVMLFLTAAHI